MGDPAVDAEKLPEEEVEDEQLEEEEDESFGKTGATAEVPDDTKVEDEEYEDEEAEEVEGLEKPAMKEAEAMPLSAAHDQVEAVSPSIDVENEPDEEAEIEEDKVEDVGLEKPSA